MAGLLAWPANLALNATNVQVAASYRAHSGQAAAQYLLVEGLAALLLGVVLGYAAFAARRLSGTRARPAFEFGAAAVVLSLAECVLGLILVAAATDDDIARGGELFRVINGLDGLKMLALAGVTAYLVACNGRIHLLPRWLHITSAALAIALVGSAVVYLLHWNAAAWTVYISGPLLLIWVTGTGVWLTVRSPARAVRARAAARR